MDVETVCGEAVQFHVPPYIKHLIFFPKLCICLSAFFSSTQKSPCFHNVEVWSNILSSRSSFLCGVRARRDLFSHREPNITLFPLIKISHDDASNFSVSLFPDVSQALRCCLRSICLWLSDICFKLCHKCDIGIKIQIPLTEVKRMFQGFGEQKRSTEVSTMFYVFPYILCGSIAI